MVTFPVQNSHFEVVVRGPAEDLVVGVHVVDRDVVEDVVFFREAVMGTFISIVIGSDSTMVVVAIVVQRLSDRLSTIALR